MNGSLIQITGMVGSGSLPPGVVLELVGIYQFVTYPTWETIPRSETFDIQDF